MRCPSSERRSASVDKVAPKSSRPISRRDRVEPRVDPRRERDCVPSWDWRSLEKGDGRADVAAVAAVAGWAASSGCCCCRWLPFWPSVGASADDMISILLCTANSIQGLLVQYTKHKHENMPERAIASLLRMCNTGTVLLVHVVF